MVLLLQTPALLQTVSHYAVHYDVPEELHAALAPSDRNLDQNESKLSIQRTLSHELLVQLVQWSKAHPITRTSPNSSVLVHSSLALIPIVDRAIESISRFLPRSTCIHFDLDLPLSTNARIPLVTYTGVRASAGCS